MEVQPAAPIRPHNEIQHPEKLGCRRRLSNTEAEAFLPRAEQGQRRTSAESRRKRSHVASWQPAALMAHSHSVYDAGAEPDPRFSLATSGLLPHGARSDRRRRRAGGTRAGPPVGVARHPLSSSRPAVLFPYSLGRSGRAPNERCGPARRGQVRPRASHWPSRWWWSSCSVS